MGIVIITGFKQRDLGIKQFKKALEIQSTINLTKALVTPEKAAKIDSAIKRLLGEGRAEMGSLFKAIGIAHPSLGILPGFAPVP